MSRAYDVLLEHHAYQLYNSKESLLSHLEYGVFRSLPRGQYQEAPSSLDADSDGGWETRLGPDQYTYWREKGGLASRHICQLHA